MSEMFSNVGERIRKILDHQKMKQVHLSKETGLSANAISSYINNLRVPDTAAIYKISKVLHTSMEWLLTGEGEMIQHKQLKPESLIMEFNVEELDAEQKELLMLFAHLGSEGKYAVKDFVRYKLSTPPQDDPNDSPKRAKKSSYFPSSNQSNNGGEIA